MRKRAPHAPLALAAVALLGVAVACGPTLQVRHYDPLHPRVAVVVDREVVGVVDYNEELEVRVERGVHLVQTIPTESNRNPWAEDGRGWRLFIDEETIITLFGNATPSDRDARAALE